MLMKAQILMTASADNTEFSEVFRFQVGIFHVFSFSVNSVVHNQSAVFYRASI